MLFNQPRVFWYIFLWNVFIISSLKAQIKQIDIIGKGADAKYIERGVSEQVPVRVTIGDKVIWNNRSNVPHTASTTKKDTSGKRLIDTGALDRNQSSTAIEITQSVYEGAGGQPGGTVELEYICAFHPDRMKSSLIIESPQRKGRTLKVRRDITSLTNSELNAYRDAWRRIQASGEFLELAGYHGCPDQFCHHPEDSATFLAWHREYLFQFESILGEPLHYWDWTSPKSFEEGLPKAFTDSTYQTSDGAIHPNPLLAFRFVCPAGTSPRTTFRVSRAPSLLRQYGAQVRSAYTAANYLAFNNSIERPPHDNVHGWVGGTMGNIAFAAYDPIFWAHHANVDRQWASWQQGGGPDPDSGTQSLVLRGFEGRQVRDVISSQALGYTYDRFDAQATRSLAVDLPDSGSRQISQGLGKTFQIPSEDSVKLMSSGATEPILLSVNGKELSSESLFVYVFVNQPDATVNDAVDTNPRFAGTFGLFGGGPEGLHGNQTSIPVLELFAGRVLENRQIEGIGSLTLLVTDETGAIVSTDKVPFDRVSLSTRNDSVNSSSIRTGIEALEFQGISENESYDEAYRNAVELAYQALTKGMADRTIDVKVVSVNGKRGGLTGSRRLVVTIAAKLSTQ